MSLNRETLLALPCSISQELLKSLNPDYALGELDMTLSEVTISFATQAISSLGLAKGFHFTGNLGFLGINTTLGFQLIPGPPSVSATISASFPGSEVEQVRLVVEVAVCPTLIACFFSPAFTCSLHIYATFHILLFFTFDSELYDN